MNSGLAVVLGALIALTGSALIPWLRESLAQRRVRAEAQRQRRDDAVVDLIAKNTKLAFMSLAGVEPLVLVTAIEDRSRAAARLLLATDDVKSRSAFSNMLNRSLTIGESTGPRGAAETGRRLRIANDLLVRWSAGDITTAELLPEWERRVKKAKSGPTPESTELG